MQGGRSIWKSFPDNIDLNQSSSSLDDAMDIDGAEDNLLNPVERGFSSYALSSGEGNPPSMDRANHNGRTLGGWDPGESSSGASIQGQLNVSNDLKIGPSWSSINDSALTDGRSVNWKYDRPDSLLYENSSNGHTRPLSTLRYRGNSDNSGYRGNSDNSGYRGNTDDGWFSSRSHVDEFPFHSANSGNLESISGSSGYMVQHHDGSSPSSSSWGLSCKRKSVEGNLSQPCSSGNLNTDMDSGFLGRHNRSSGYNASSSLGNVSSPSINLQGSSHHGQLNPRTRENYGFHPSSGNDTAETSERNFSFRPDSGLHLHEQGSFDSSRNIGFNSAHHLPRFTPSSELPEMRAPSFSRPSNLHSTPSHSHMMQASGSSRHLHRHGPAHFIAPSGPSLFSGERSSASREEGSFRSSQHSHLEHSDFSTPPEAVHTIQEPPFWHFSHGPTNSLRNVSSSTRISPSSSSYPFPPVWMPHQSPAAPEPGRYADLPPWSLFPSVEPEPRGQRFSFFPSASSSSEETVISTGSSAGDLNQPHPRSTRMDASSDDVNRWRGLAATRGRQRLTSEIHQVLSAMRRGEAFRAEDYVLFDPFTIGAAATELHDRHRDMRLDVDNMSYEELLALEERIGDVKTGLSEDFIMRSMRQRKHRLFMLDSSNPEPCCICQDDYVTGDDVGVLDCGHEFHTNCITQWLTVKNLCPICKTTALES